MNAIDFLLKEHQKVRAAFQEINEPSHQIVTKKKMFTQLCDDLIRHETMEHTIWYPLFINEKKVDDTVKHLISEEKHAEKSIKEFDKVASEDEWLQKLSNFQKNVEHHAKEEETKLFPMIKKLFTDDELVQIGHAMLEFKQQYIKEHH